MLSALIRTEHSYPALLLAEQLVDQRFVHPGPLVTYSLCSHHNANTRMYANDTNTESISHVTMGADYIFPPL